MLFLIAYILCHTSVHHRKRLIWKSCNFFQPEGTSLLRSLAYACECLNCYYTKHKTPLVRGLCWEAVVYVTVVTSTNDVPARRAPKLSTITNQSLASFCPIICYYGKWPQEFQLSPMDFWPWFYPSFSKIPFPLIVHWAMLGLLGCVGA